MKVFKGQGYKPCCWGNFSNLMGTLLFITILLSHFEFSSITGQMRGSIAPRKWGYESSITNSRLIAAILLLSFVLRAVLTHISSVLACDGNKRSNSWIPHHVWLLLNLRSGKSDRIVLHSLIALRDESSLRRTRIHLGIQSIVRNL